MSRAITDFAPAFAAFRENPPVLQKQSRTFFPSEYFLIASLFSF